MRYPVCYHHRGDPVGMTPVVSQQASSCLLCSCLRIHLSFKLATQSVHLFIQLRVRSLTCLPLEIRSINAPGFATSTSRGRTHRQRLAAHSSGTRSTLSQWLAIESNSVCVLASPAWTEASKVSSRLRFQIAMKLMERHADK